MHDLSRLGVIVCRPADNLSESAVQSGTFTQPAGPGTLCWHPCSSHSWNECRAAPAARSGREGTPAAAVAQSGRSPPWAAPAARERRSTGISVHAARRSIDACVRDKYSGSGYTCTGISSTTHSAGSASQACAAFCACFERHRPLPRAAVQWTAKAQSRTVG